MKIENSKISNRIWIAPFILVVMIATYTLIIGTWSVNRYMSFNATLWDMGIMLQAIWNTAHGRILHESVNLGFSASRLVAAHWELIYLPLAVIYRLIPSNPLLLYIQSFVLACGTIPIYKLAVKKLSSQTTALLISIAYLFYPALHGANLFDLHGLTFATTFLLFCFYYLDKNKQAPTIAFAILSLSCREDVALVVFMLSLFAWIVKKNRQCAVPLVILSVIWITAFSLRAYWLGPDTLAETTRLAPNWRHLGVLNFSSSPNQKITVIFQLLFSQDNPKYLAKLMLPVAGLCLLSPSIILIAAPILLMNLVSQWHQMHQIEYHYTATITPFIFLATIKGMANLKRWLARFPKFLTNRIQLVIGSIVVLSSVVSTTQFSILRFHKTWRVSESDKNLSQQLQAIHSNLSVSATARVGAHLANRKELYHFPERCSEADIIVLELNRPEVEIKNFTGTARTKRVTAMNELAQAIFQDTTLGLRFVQDNVFCWQRGLASTANFEKAFFLEKMPSDASPSNKIDIGNGLYLLGWKSVYIGKKQAHFQLFWSTNRPQPETTQLNFYLTSADSKLSILHQPIFGKIPIREWEPGRVVVDHLFVNRPEDIDVKTYSVMVSTSKCNNSQRIHLFDFNFP